MTSLQESAPLENGSRKNSSIQNQVADANQGELCNESASSAAKFRIDGPYPRGYPELAAFMRSDPEIGIFRRFDYLHLRELLYLQEELTHLEEQLHTIDRTEPIEINIMSRRLDSNEERKKVISEIRVRLLDYGTVVSRNYTHCSMNLIIRNQTSY
jgi:hypothetical protein